MKLTLPGATLIAAALAASVLFTLGAGAEHPRSELLFATGVGVFSIALFATRVFPDIVAAFLVFLISLSVSIAPPGVVFSGLASGGFWLLVGGIILGVAVTATGLGTQISNRMLALSGASYSKAVLVVASAGFLLGILIPSTIPRVLILIPVAVALADSLGLKPGSRGSMGLCATAAAGTLLPTYAIYTANLPTIVQFGALESLYSLKATYSGYLLAQFPVNLVRFAVLLLVLCLLNTEPVDRRRAGTQSAEGLTGRQTRLLVLLLCAIALWATDFVHGIQPAWIALAVATIALWPKSGLLPAATMKEKVDLTPALLFSAIFCVSALARHVGLDVTLANSLIERMSLVPGEIFWNVYAIFGFSVLISHLTTAPAAPLVLAPLAEPLASASGLPLETVAMTQMIGIASPLLPYQAPPLIIAMSLAEISTGLLTRICLFLFAAVVLFGLPLTILWWQFTGLLPSAG
ncbi:SLC13 family permease [uncultured Roseibium sp.]|uniref:SLC13 family permease n=1 Tax=uncultured Roseibium sp. TaxID=1936171 RepID=UPI00262705A9|nr:SLC13 family permease [uncultured Roseibium sp.]